MREASASKLLNFSYLNLDAGGRDRTYAGTKPHGFYEYLF